MLIKKALPSNILVLLLTISALTAYKLDKLQNQEKALTIGKNTLSVNHSALEYLKSQVPESEINGLNERMDDLEDKNMELVMAGYNNSITQDIIQNLGGNRLSKFLEDDYYKQLLKKIQEDQNTVKTGEYLLKFDSKYLSPEKVLNIGISDKNITIDGKANGMCDFKFREQDDMEHYPVGIQSFICKKNYISVGKNFNDKHIRFPRDNCYKVSENSSAAFDNIQLKYNRNVDKPFIYFWYRYYIYLYAYCHGSHNVKDDYVDSDLPLFHIEDIETGIIEFMKYHLLAKEKTKYDHEYNWNIQKVDGTNDNFIIENFSKKNKKLCMYELKGYYSLVIDQAPGNHTECHWYKKDRSLYNVLHNRCISITTNLPDLDPPENSIQLAGFNDNEDSRCVVFSQEKPIAVEQERFLRKSGIAAME